MIKPTRVVRIGQKFHIDELTHWNILRVKGNTCHDNINKNDNVSNNNEHANSKNKELKNE